MVIYVYMQIQFNYIIFKKISKIKTKINWVCKAADVYDANMFYLIFKIANKF